jgi:hypothetical protein
MPRVDFASGVYEVLGYLIPGIVVAWSVRVLADDVLGISDVPEVPSSTFEITIFFLFAPVAGFLIQALGRHIERHLINERDPQGKRRYHSQLFRLAENTHYTPEFKERFEEVAAKTFGLPDGTREAFDLAYHYLLVNDKARVTDIFNSLYGMSRGLALTFCLAAVAQAILAAKVASDGGEAWQEPSAIALVLAAGVWLALIQARSFSMRFADSVFRGFLAATSAGPTS